MNRASHLRDTVHRTFRPGGMKCKSTPAASKSPIWSTHRGGASCRPLRLSVSTGGDALFRMRGDSRVGLLARERAEDARLAGGANVVLSLSVSTLSLPSCDALCTGSTSSASSTPSTLRRLGLSPRWEGDLDMARLGVGVRVRVRVRVCGPSSCSSGGVGNQRAAPVDCSQFCTSSVLMFVFVSVFVGGVGVCCLLAGVGVWFGAWFGLY